MAHAFFNDGDALFFDQGDSSKQRGLNGQPIKVYRAIVSAAVASEATLRKTEEGTSITWEEFVAFLRIHRVTTDGCTCANYCMFAMCEGVLLWLLVREPKSKVPSQYSWEIVAQRPLELGRIERKVTARAEQSRKLRTRQSRKLALREKKPRKKVVASSDTDSDGSVSTLAQKAPSDGGSKSTNLGVPQKVDGMEEHWKNCLNLFRPPMSQSRVPMVHAL